MIALGVYIAVLFFYSLVSRRSLKTIITAPILFTGAGILLFFTFPEQTDVDLKDKTFLVLGQASMRG